MIPIDYASGFVAEPGEIFAKLKSELAWVRRDNTPRSEYYCNDLGVPYTYGSGTGIRTYEAQPYSDAILSIRKKLEALAGVAFEVCFLNLYLNQRDHLGWHADDSPEMDDDRPIAIVSLGVEREIWFRPLADRTDVTKQLLQNGSLCLMKAGMQKAFYHRIPKAGFLCGERISLTFRGYKSPGT